MRKAMPMSAAIAKRVRVLRGHVYPNERRQYDTPATATAPIIRPLQYDLKCSSLLFTVNCPMGVMRLISD